MEIETFSFWDKDHYEYEIFSILSIAWAWTSVILAGKRDSWRHSTTSFCEHVAVVKINYQMLEVLSLCDQEWAFKVKTFNNDNVFDGKKYNKTSWGVCFWQYVFEKSFSPVKLKVADKRAHLTVK